MKTKKIKIIPSYTTIKNKPSTVTRAGITADIKLTRGKELVEHNPSSLIPDPHNPRPGDIIDDQWLIKYLNLGSESFVCKNIPETNDYYIPSSDEICKDLPTDVKEHYDFLRSLAYSIRSDGLIEPIEIFLADRENDPEYFQNTVLDYGYVVLEGHQRRLAAMIAGVNTVTCIKITDETILSRLKFKNRKLRRQLSENNLRKDLSVAQNFKIVRSLLNSPDSNSMSIKELSSVIGLNEDIAGTLKRLSLNAQQFPSDMIKVIEDNKVTFKWIRTWISKPFDEIQSEIKRLQGEITIDNQVNKSQPEKKIRGTNGGAIKRSATFKITTEKDSQLLLKFLQNKIPELGNSLYKGTFKDLETILFKLLDLAKIQESTQVEN